MNDNGWVKMYRKTENNPIVCKDNDYFRVWHHLLYKANHQTQYVIFNNEKIEIKPGQYITGRKQISEACNVSESKAERILKWFENDQQIEQQTSSKGRLITIINWNKYQQIEQQFGQKVGNVQTIIDQRTLTNKNDKNDKNNKNDKNVRNNIYNNSIIRAQSQNTNLFEFIENSFGRTLNPVEYEEISFWEDCDLTRYAIKQAVLLNKFSIKYISRILDTYNAENIKTVQQAQNRETDFKSQIKNKKSNNFISKETLSEKLKRLEKEAQEYDQNEVLKND